MIRASFFRFSPLLLLTAALVALAIFFVHDSSPASADHDDATTVWSAMLTMRDLGSGAVGCNSGNAITINHCSATSTLTNNTFTIAAATYTIDEIATDGSGLNLSLTTEVSRGAYIVLNAYSLYVGHKSFQVVDATRSGGSANDALWPNHGLSWSGGDVVQLELALMLPKPATPDPPPLEERTYLIEAITPPMAPAFMYWHWESGTDLLREVITDFTIHNDIGDWSDRHGLYLFLMHNSISETRFYFGLQTDVQGRGKGLIFSRWGTRDLSNARFSATDGWTQSSGHEGNFIGVRRSYEWKKGDYRVRIAPDGLESDGEWFSLWITDLATGNTTWVGSLKFPLLNGAAVMQPHSLATIEVYGTGPIRPIDVPKWHVTVKRPLGDGVVSTWGYTWYPYDDSESALLNSDVRYDRSTNQVHLLIGGDTERRTPQENPITFGAKDPTQGVGGL